nr:Uncharacterised protein [Raoultella sp. NCTC 9187]
MGLLGGLHNSAAGPAIQQQAEVVDLRLNPLELALIGLAVEQVDSLSLFAAGNASQRRLLFVLQLVGNA